MPDQDSSTNSKRLYLLDAFALIYRAHFAFIRNPLMNSKGMNVSAITGFVNTLYDLLHKEEFKPTHMAVCFDTPGPTDRAVEYEFYKANREAMPEDIRASLPYIRSIIEGFNIPLLEAPGYEADDVIGTLAKMGEKEGFDVYMVTPDKDYGQLVTEKIFMYKPSYQRNPREILGVNEILEKWNIARIDQVIDMLGMMGDAVDNIPGIAGVGQKTAAKLLKKFDSMEGVLENSDKIKGKLREKVEAAKEMAIISKELATIILDAPVEFDADKLVLEPINKEILEPIFTELEFRSLGKRVLGEGYEFNVAQSKKAAPKGPQQGDLFAAPVNEIKQQLLPAEEVMKGLSIEDVDHDYKLCESIEEQEELLSTLLKQKVVCFDTETTGVNANLAELVGFSFCYESGKAFYVPIPEAREEAQKVVERFRPFFENEEIGKIAQNLKYDMLMLKWYQLEVKGQLHDTMLAHYLIEPDMRHNMNILAETYLNYTPVSIETLIGKKGKNQLSMREAPLDKVADYAAEDADITFQLFGKFEPAVEESAFKNVYKDIEIPLVRVLTDMEFEGINLDVPFLEEFSGVLDGELISLKEKIVEVAGVDFNLDSPKQLGNILFDVMEIPYKGKKTKTGQYSTNEETLVKLSHEHPFVGSILDYRELKKLNSTYVSALPKLVNPKTGRIHTTFNQAVAATGRLSSTNPNLQNIPIRTPRGREVRKAFIPRNKDHILLAVDYSQIELRLMAEMSGDENMKSAFIDGLDIHSATAARVYHVPFEEVDTEMRRKAKTVNFGIIYGISAFGLSQRIGISRTEAKEIIEEYFNAYPGIKTYMDLSVAKAKENGYCETLMGRRRYLKDINSKNHTIRSFAERNAINAPIQGSAADLIKMAMINVHDEMKRRELKSRMLLQVHDELVFDVEKSELDEMKAMVTDKMEKAMTGLQVPIIAEAGTGNNWLEAH